MLNADQLIELAAELASGRGPGAPRQVVLRRAVSTTYYAVFHTAAGEMAASFASTWKSRVLFYRAIEHGKTKERCRRLASAQLPAAENDFFGRSSFCSGLRKFANDFVALQELRHSCDYDPDYKLSRAGAQEAIETARSAIAALRNAPSAEHEEFLAYLLLGMRRP